MAGAGLMRISVDNDKNKTVFNAFIVYPHFLSRALL